MQFRLKAAFICSTWQWNSFSFSSSRLWYRGLSSPSDPTDFEHEFCCGYARLTLPQMVVVPPSCSLFAVANGGAGAGMSEPLSSDGRQQQREFLLNLSPFNLSAQRKASGWRRSPWPSFKYFSSTAVAGKTWLLIGCRSCHFVSPTWVTSTMQTFPSPFSVPATDLPNGPASRWASEGPTLYSIFHPYLYLHLYLDFSTPSLSLCVYLFICNSGCNVHKSRPAPAERAAIVCKNVQYNKNSRETPTTSTLGLNLRQDADVAAHKFVYMPQDCDT